MPITASDEQNDARGTARLLAQAAEGYIADLGLSEDRELVLNNVYRLIRKCRSRAFFQEDPSPDAFPYYSGEGLSLLPPMERHVEDVRRALKAALQETFRDEQSGEALDLLEHVLRQVTYPDEFGAPSDEGQRKAISFFHHVIENLQHT